MCDPAVDVGHTGVTMAATNLPPPPPGLRAYPMLLSEQQQCWCGVGLGDGAPRWIPIRGGWLFNQPCDTSLQRPTETLAVAVTHSDATATDMVHYTGGWPMGGGGGG